MLSASDLRTEFLTEATLPETLAHLRALGARFGHEVEVREIGVSREGRPLVGLKLGTGPLNVTLTAGAHADEPIGPITAIALVECLLSSEERRAMLRSFTLAVCPQVNPDGAERNRPWFADPPDALTYLRHAVRELPGDDIEFGYPDSGAPETDIARGETALRPENEAVAKFLRGFAPVAVHASLHGMSVAEGAWFLIGHNWINRTAPLRKALTAAVGAAGLPLHDIDRRGDKGFFRIAPGYCTTPTSAGMRDHFLARNDPDSAAQFRLNSMEYVQSLGGDPLVMVSEIPLFLIGEGVPASLESESFLPPISPTRYEAFRARLPQAGAALHQGNSKPADELFREFKLRPVPLTTHVQLQGQMVLEAMKLLAGISS